MPTILKVSRQIENPTTSIDAYLLEEQSRKIYPNPIWNDRDLGFIWREVPQQEEKKQD